MIFLDQDCLVTKDWLSAILGYVENPAIDAVGGSVANANLSNCAGSVLFFLEFMHQIAGPPQQICDPYFLIGCNLALKSKIFDKVSFPDRTMAEDVIFSAGLKRAGFKLLYDPSLTVAHINKSGWRNVWAYLYRLGKAARDYYSYAESRRSAILLRYPWFAYISCFFVLPFIFLKLLAAGNIRYLSYFIILTPLCWIGHLRWARGFCKRHKEITIARKK